MGVEMLIKMRNGVIFTMKGCFRSVCNHPFLVCLLCVLIIMCRSSPYMFSWLVYASPVLVCTAVLLGTLLFFGQANVLKFGRKEEASRDAVARETELKKDGVAERNERRDESEQGNVGSSLSGTKRDDVCSEGSVDGSATFDKNGEVLERKRELDEQKSEWNDGGLSDGEVMEKNHYGVVRKANDPESEYDKSEAESFDSEMVNVDSLASSGRSSWKLMGQKEDEDDDALDSGTSDQAESSSPDASMAEMMPMLDELHPLLDEDAPQPIQMSRACSEAPSALSSTSSIGSVDETDNPDDSVAEDGEDDDDDDDEEEQEKGFRTNSAITWTEEDQKNLMEVGSSEIERNQRLENLILRRRTRKKNMSMVPEFNLIDLDSSDFPHHIPSISTSRQNPFDEPHDSYDNLGLPPIPGSAPSILLPRRNPFDVPYDSSEENQNVMGDGSQEEHKTLQSRDAFFRRRENFSAGPSVFAPSRQDLKLRPYFIPERMVIEEPSYSTLQQQSGEMSESKASSAPDSESVSSLECVEDQKLEEYQDQISKMEFYEEDAPYEPDVIPEMKHVGEDVGHGSQSSEGEECLGSVENRESEVNDFKFQSESEAVEQTQSGRSSISSLSEVSDKVFTKTDDEGPIIHDVAVEPDATSALVDDAPHKEPVYDSSPKRGNDDISFDLSGVEQRSDENFTDEQSHGDKTLGESEEEKRLTSSERESSILVEAPQVESAKSPTSDADFEEACEKISTPSAGGSAPHFYVRAMHEKDFEHLEEVQVPNTPVEPTEKARGIQNIHIPGLRELDRDVLPNTKSSVIPESNSKPEEEAVSHVDTQTTNEEANVIKDIHEGKLSELDSVGGISIEQKESGPRELEKHREAETSDTGVVEVNPVEVNKIEHQMDMEKSRDETDDVGTDHKKEMMLPQEKLEPNADARSVEVKGEKLESSVGEQSSFREGEGKIPEDPQYGSDTEKETKSSFWAKRRLSTPFF